MKPIKADPPILNCGNCRLSSKQDGDLVCWAEPPRIDGENIVRGVPTEEDAPACHFWIAGVLCQQQAGDG